MSNTNVAGAPGQRRLSCAKSALIAAAVILPTGCLATEAAQAQSQPQSNTPLPAIPVKTQKKKKPKPPVQRAPSVRQGADVVEGEAEPADAPEKRGVSTPLSSSSVQGESVTARRAETNDTAALLSNTPGVSLYQGGGVSSLPSIHGMADDRIKIGLNGMEITSACANHMNSPLSYIDPAAVQRIDVMAGVTPVSSGGDSIGGTIEVVTLPAEFAKSPNGVETHGSFSAFFRSNPATTGASASGSIATSNFSAKYTGQWVNADSYYAGGDRFVPGSAYEINSHLLTLAAKGRSDLLVVDLGYQHIPFQYFPNQPMDMSGNDAWYVNARYETKFDWGKLFLKGYYHQTVHEMDTLEEHWVGGVPSHMLMNTEGYDTGYQVKAEIPLAPWSLIRVGNEYHHQWLNDWYPGTTDFYAMPQDFISVNNGTRDRVGTFAEWEAKWSPRWTTLLGVRNDVVWMNTGEVQGYFGSAYDHSWSDPFNAADRSRTDVNFDVTGQVRHQASDTATYELGLARKTRTPNLFERYAWWDHNGMITWFGDLNGYHGNLDLNPETAYTASFTADWHDRDRKRWQIKVTPYYTYVDDYVGVHTESGGLGSHLQFVNHAAELYGVDVAGRYVLLPNSSVGSFALNGVIGYVHGEDLDNHTSLYHMKPLNAKLALEHKWGNWTNVAELEMVAAKDSVDTLRSEPVTPGYALVNLRSSYQWEHVRLDFGVRNLFDQLYYHPMGGVDVMQWSSGISCGPSGCYIPPKTALESPGRSIYVGLTMKF